MDVIHNDNEVTSMKKNILNMATRQSNWKSKMNLTMYAKSQLYKLTVMYQFIFNRYYRL